MKTLWPYYEVKLAKKDKKNSVILTVTEEAKDSAIVVTVPHLPKDKETIIKKGDTVLFYANELRKIGDKMFVSHDSIIAVLQC